LRPALVAVEAEGEGEGGTVMETVGVTVPDPAGLPLIP
jgi:hypothetical protein